MVKKDQERLDYLDMVKGIGIILVVAGHSGYIPDAMLTWLASFHMPLFFIVSGILFGYKGALQTQWSDFVRKRWRGMIIPYISFSIIFFIIYTYYHVAHPDLISRDFLINSLLEAFSGYGISVLWFLPCIFAGECLFYRVLKWVGYDKHLNSNKPEKPFKRLLIYLVLLIVPAMIPVFGKQFLETYLHADGSYLTNFITLLSLSILRVFPAIVFLSLGLITYRLMIEGNLMDKFLLKYFSGKTKKHLEMVIGILLLILNLAIAFKNGRVDMHFLVYNHVLLFYLGALSATLGLILICKNIKDLWLLSFMGANSLIVMATHLDCQVMSNGIRFASIINRYIIRGKEIIFRFNLCIFLIVSELIIVYLINRYGYKLIGKNAPVSMKTPVFVKKIVRKFKAI